MRLFQVAAFAGLLAFGGAANAALTYTFSVAPDGGWDPFSFSFTTPTFLAAGDPFSFTPFTITNGAFSYLINTSGSTTLATQGRCFLFGSGDQVLQNGANTQCQLGNGPAGQADFWVFDGNTSLPTTVGLISGLYVAIFTGDPTFGQDFNATLDISGTATTVPEPASWALMLGGFTLIGTAMRRRNRAYRTA
jgi:hypothetical protein